MAAPLAFILAGAPPPLPVDVASPPRLFVATPTQLRGELQNVNRPWSPILQPGALIASDPLSSAANAVRERLGSVGLHYALTQAITFAAVTEPAVGESTAGAYSFQFNGNWDLFDSDDLGGTSGWCSLDVIGGAGFGFDWQSTDLRARRDALVSPNNNAWGVDIAVEELAWAQSFAAGEVVLVGGMINQQNYIDLNRYAGSAFGQLLNSGFVNNVSVPFATNNLGMLVQWQPVDWLYVMAAMGTNNQPIGTSPFRDVSLDDVTWLGEIGFVFEDLGGLGPALWRVQPFVATVDGATGGGAALNIEQKLGRDGPFGLFGRFGASDDVAASVGGIRASAAGGLAVMSPFAREGFLSQDNNDYAALGLSWAEAAGMPGVADESELALELTFVLQVTPTATIQPDIQLIWNNRADSPDGPEVVFQLQLNLAW